MTTSFTAPNGAPPTAVDRAKIQGTEEIRPRVAPMPSPSAPVRQTIQAAALQAADRPRRDSGALLHVGPGITVKGDISGCEMLRVEGAIDGNSFSRHLVLCSGGSIVGYTETDEAEIEGHCDGTLNVKGRLTLRNGGRVTGTIGYGQLEIERGGELAGQVTPQSGQAAVPGERQSGLQSPVRSRSEGANGHAHAAPTPPAAPPLDHGANGKNRKNLFFSDR